MESKDIFLVIGLIVVLGVVVSLSTLTITGNVARKANPDGTFTSESGVAEISDVERVVDLAHDNLLATLKDAKAVSKTVSTTATSTSQAMKCSDICSQQGMREPRNKCLFGLFDSKHGIDELSSAVSGTIIVSCDKQVKVVSGDILSCYCGK